MSFEKNLSEIALSETQLQAHCEKMGTLLSTRPEPTEQCMATAVSDFQACMFAYTTIGPEDVLERLKTKSFDDPIVVEFVARSCWFLNIATTMVPPPIEDITDREILQWKMAGTMTMELSVLVDSMDEKAKLAVQKRMMTVPLPPPFSYVGRAVKLHLKCRRRAALEERFKDKPAPSPPSSSAPDYHVPPTEEEKEKEARRKALAVRTRAMRETRGQPYTASGPSHIPPKPPSLKQLSAEEMLARRRWKEEAPLRKQAHLEAQAHAQRAAKERARKKAQKERRRATIRAATEEHVASPPSIPTIGDFM